MTQPLGWPSSFVLILTLVKQSWKQWCSGPVECVSSRLSNKL